MKEIGKPELAPLNYLKIIFRRKELFLIPALVGLVLGICSGIVLPKKYISSAILLVEEGKTDNPLFDKLAVSSTIRQRIATIKESMLGWNSLVKLVKRMNLDRNIKSPQELENLIIGIKSNIFIKMRGENIIDISYVGETPEITQGIVKNITEIFIDRNLEIQNQETGDAIGFIEEQLKLYRGKIKSAELAQLKDSLNTLLVDSTDKHPRVIELKEQVAAKEAELKRENLQYQENVTLDAMTTNPIISEIRKALTTIEGQSTGTTKETKLAGKDSDLYKVMLIDKLDNVMARDANVNSQVYNTLLQRLETAKITQRLQSSKEGTRYTILDPPRLPLKPSKPNKILVALAGFFLGSFLGVGLIVSIEMLDKSFIDVEDAKNFLGVPLFGAISRINTDISIQRERERQVWFYSVALVAGIAAILVTTAIANFLK